MEPVTGHVLPDNPQPSGQETGKQDTGKVASTATGTSTPTGKGIGALLASATVSRLADQSASIALVLVVIARTHNPRLAGLVVAAFTVPALLTGPVIGAYLDQLRAKRALFVANQATLAAALAGVAVLAGHAPGAVLIVLGLCAGLTAPVLTGGFSSLVPLVVPPAGLRRANALDAATYNVAGLAGPALVAVIAGAAGAGLALSAVAGIATLGLALVLAAPMPVAATAADQAIPGSLPKAVADGLQLLRDVPLLRSTTIATTLSQFTQGMLPIALPLLAVSLGHPTSAGAWLLTALSVGGLAGSLASERLLARRTAPAVLVVALAAGGACLGALAATPGFGVALGVAVLAGIADGPLFAATLHIRQRAVPPDRYAQTAATAASLKTGAYALGAAVAGLLAGVLAARQLVLLVGIGQFVALVPFLDRQARKMITGAATAVLSR